MDPVSIIGIAAAILQFLDLGLKIVTEARDQSSRARLDKATRIVAELDIQRRVIQRTVQLLPPSSSASLAVVNYEDTERDESKDDDYDINDTDETLRVLAGKALRLSGELQDLVTHIQGHKDERSSLNVKVRIFFSDAKIDKLSSELQQTRNIMNAAVSALVLEGVRVTSVNVAAISQQQGHVMARLDHMDKALDQTLVRMTGQTFPANDLRRTIINALWSQSQPLPSGHTNTPSSQPVPDTGQDEDTVLATADDEFIKDMGHVLHYKPARSLHVTESILKSIASDFRSREDDIPKAHQATFRWIFENPSQTPDGQPMWPDFPQWLRCIPGPGATTPIYWITGKPGSGKSTLMKYVSSQPDFQSHLHEWADAKPLIVAKFYIWNAGIELQRSLPGLLRSLLAQVLAGAPELIPRVQPLRWAMEYVLGSDEHTGAWTATQLYEALRTFDSIAGDNYAVAYMIDGLDEIEGHPGDLIDLVKALNSGTQRKVCVSSRYYTQFQDAFADSPQFEIHRFTQKDMRVYVSDKFNVTPAFRTMKMGFPEDACRLEESILEKAQGVFLWVSIVVRHLCEAIAVGNSLASLELIINDLPSDIETLYDRIWSSVDCRYRQDAAHIFMFVGKWHDLTYVDDITFWAALQENYLDIDTRSWIQAKFDSVRENLRRRLSSRTRGLIELSPITETVGYLHRTVKEWCETRSRWDDIASCADPGIDVNLQLMKGLYTRRGQVWDDLAYGHMPRIDDKDKNSAAYPLGKFLQFAAFFSFDNAKWTIVEVMLDGYFAALDKASKERPWRHWSQFLEGRIDYEAPKHLQPIPVSKDGNKRIGLESQHHWISLLIYCDVQRYVYDKLSTKEGCVELLSCNKEYPPLIESTIFRNFGLRDMAREVPRSQYYLVRHMVEMAVRHDIRQVLGGRCTELIQNAHGSSHLGDKVDYQGPAYWKKQRCSCPDEGFRLDRKGKPALRVNYWEAVRDLLVSAGILPSRTKRFISALSGRFTRHPF